MRRRLVAAAIAAAAGFAWAGETAETYRGALAALFSGRPAEAEEAYKYLLTLGVDGAGPTANLAVLAREQGRADEAVALWTRATLLDSYNPVLWNERGWAHLAIGRLKEARESFQKAVEVSSGPQHAAEASFGLGVAEQIDGNPKSAIAAYQNSFTRNPYLLPAVATQLARLAVKLKKWPTAETYYKQSLDQDPQQPDVALELGRVLEKEGQTKAAWQAYKLVLDMDPQQDEAREGMTRVAKSIDERPERYLPVRRLTRPLLTRSDAAPPSQPYRVALFTDPTGEPSHGTRFFFLSGSDFRVVDVRLGEVTKGGALDQWEVRYRDDTRVIELRDPQQNLKFTTKQAFRIEPVRPGFTVLVKSAVLGEVKAVDIGDREVRGIVEVVPTPHGFGLVNEVALEDYLSGIVGAAMPSTSPREALRAQAVLARTKAMGVRKGQHHPFFNADLCDSTHCHLYSGVVRESAAVREAVVSTTGGRLTTGGLPARVAWHASCGWATEEHGEDADRPLGIVRSAWDLDRLARSYPPAGLFCERSALTPPAWSRWTRVLDADLLRQRIERTQFIGRLHDVRVVSRSKTGRVTALDVLGSRETLRLEGAGRIEAFLAPRSLRSTLFTLQPLYDGKVLRQLVVWGAGTGDGHGLCVAGSMGQAHQGRKYRNILAHYFPGTEVKGAPDEPPAVTAVKARGGVTVKEQARARAKRAARLREAQRERAAKRKTAAPAPSTSTAPSGPPEAEEPQPQ
ncbi:MAG: SpoIID/LytB domain-containing protein [Elusimicrobia bacterium]|nr:SpoIID/LytB domain-containing protein [Elusimicrobiota bacterium]